MSFPLLEPVAKRQRLGETVAFMGIDVGTGGARAAVFDICGRLLGEGAAPLKIRTPKKEHFEQSSEDIWRACCSSVQAAKKEAGAVEIRGIAFDATCSLVVLGQEDVPLAVSADEPSGDEGEVFNVILWCDHRAIGEADSINRSGHRLLQNVGGAVSPEMEMPKLSWLKANKPQVYQQARRFFDLTDWLTYRAAGGASRFGEGRHNTSEVLVLALPAQSFANGTSTRLLAAGHLTSGNLPASRTWARSVSASPKTSTMSVLRCQEVSLPQQPQTSDCLKEQPWQLG
mmetsp:Transcript_60311/g.127712  ORF Transcript_60311/g.127712 Transcript_60311/m.127712 type:complete len:286 (+) Transcript_60311:57-914(+)